MSRFKNPGVVAQGMLAPSGNLSHDPDPYVQATARPAGSLLPPSPGFDSVRVGKNRFQGKGPTGGFRPMQFAEDVGGTGAALALVPGDTASIAASEWLPEGDDALGRMVISDRELKPGFAEELHEGLMTLPDMGDRSPGRPRTKATWLYNPIGMFRKDFQESPAITVGATVLLVVLVNILAKDAERQFRAHRGRGVTGAASGAAIAPVAVAGDQTKDAVDAIEETTTKAVTKIEEAADSAVNAIKDAGESAASAVKETTE